MRLEEKKDKIEVAEGLSQCGRSEMCDYSLYSIKSRPAKVGDKLTTRYFGTGTRGFAASEDSNVVVPFDQEPRYRLLARSCANRLVSLVGEIR